MANLYGPDGFAVGADTLLESHDANWVQLDLGTGDLEVMNATDDVRIDASGGFEIARWTGAVIVDQDIRGTIKIGANAAQAPGWWVRTDAAGNGYSLEYQRAIGGSNQLVLYRVTDDNATYTEIDTGGAVAASTNYSTAYLRAVGSGATVTVTAGDATNGDVISVEDTDADRHVSGAPGLSVFNENSLRCAIDDVTIESLDAVGGAQEGDASDIAEASDTPTSSKGTAGALTDVGVSSDATAASKSTAGGLADGAVASEDIATIHGTAGAPEIAVSSDAPVAQHDAIQRPTDSAVSADTLFGSLGGTRSLTDLSLASDTPATAWAGTASVSDVAVALDAAVREGDLLGAADDIAVASDAVAAKAAFGATRQDVSVASDLSAIEKAAHAAGTDIAIGSDAAHGLGSAVRQASDIAIATDVATPFARLFSIASKTGPAIYESMFGDAL